MRGGPLASCLLALTGAVVGVNAYCSPDVCVTGAIEGSTVTYTVESQHALSEIGWIGVGFGTQMVGAHMVVMWPNPDGKITLSQRSASGHFMPAVDPSPPSVATLSTGNSSLTATKPVFVFTMPAPSSTTQNMLWAFGPVSSKPSGEAADSTFDQHDGHDTFSLTLSGGSSSSSSSSDSGSGSDSSAVVLPWLDYQKLIVAHAALSSIGFLVLLPLGGLLARWARTFVPGPVWFNGHWIINFGLAGPAIIAGFALAYVGVQKAGGGHSSTHTMLGLALFVLYLIQVTLGNIIHYIKPRRPTGRPVQNYVHAVLGIAIIALAFWQVRLGYKQEFKPFTGHPVPDSVNSAWLALVIIIPVAYFAGTALLPRQYRLEAESRARAAEKRSSEDTN